MLNLIYIACTRTTGGSRRTYIYIGLCCVCETTVGNINHETGWAVPAENEGIRNL